MAGSKGTNPGVLRLPSLLQVRDPGSPMCPGVQDVSWCVVAGALRLLDADGGPLALRRQFWFVMQIVNHCNGRGISRLFGYMSDWKMESEQDLLAFNPRGSFLVL